MSLFNKVIWSEGMFLRPQHFQQQDRYVDNFVRRSIIGLRACPWGVRVFEIDRNLLEVGKFSVPVCEGLMPDGTVFRAPEDEAPPAVLDLGEDVRNSLVFLALAVEQGGAEGAEAMARSDGTGRHDSREIEVYDTARNSLGSRAAIEVGRLRLRLMLERDERAGYLCIPIARIREVTADRKILLDDSFIASCLDCSAARPLAAFVRELEGLLHQRGEVLAARVSASGRGGVAEIADFLLLQLVNRLEPVVCHLTGLTGCHPEEFYRFLLEAAGELATFTAPAKRPEAFPFYRHDALTETFEPVFLAIRQSLSLVMDPGAVQIPLEERKFGIRVGIIHDRGLLESATFVLAVRADMDPDVLARTIRAQSKIGPVEKIRELVNLALPGVPLRQRPVAPRQIPYHSGSTYFELDTTNELWKALDRSGGLAIHVAGNFPNLAMDLWAIKR